MSPCGAVYAQGKKEKMARLTAAPEEQFAESATLEEEIRENLVRLGYDRI